MRWKREGGMERGGGEGGEVEGERALSSSPSFSLSCTSVEGEEEEEGE